MPLTGGSFSAGLKWYSLTVVGPAVSWLDSAGSRDFLQVNFWLGLAATARRDWLGSDQITAIHRQPDQRQNDSATTI